MKCPLYSDKTPRCLCYTAVFSDTPTPACVSIPGGHVLKSAFTPPMKTLDCVFASPAEQMLINANLPPLKSQLRLGALMMTHPDLMGRAGRSTAECIRPAALPRTFTMFWHVYKHVGFSVALVLAFPCGALWRHLGFTAHGFTVLVYCT